MFGNFIFFIVALLVYATYPPVDVPRFAPGMTAVIFVAILVFFTFSVRETFRKISAGILAGMPEHQMAHRFDLALKKCGIGALIAFVIVIYGLNLPDYVDGLDIFLTFPTVAALIFISLFIIFMVIVWDAAYHCQHLLFPGRISRRAYVSGQLSLNLPVLLPWVALSALMDLINILPFDAPRRFLATSLGQALYFLIFLVLTAVLAPALIRIFWRCRPLADGPARYRIESLSRRAGVRFAAILHWPLFGGRMLTAGVMGLVGRFRYLLVTDALLQLLTPAEIDSVIAHELGHVRKKHLLFYLLFLCGYMLVSLSILDLIVYFIVYSRPATIIIEALGQDRTGTAGLLLTLATIGLFFVYFRYFFGYFMRNFERQADTYVYTLFDSARPLISTLNKIAFTSGQPADKPNWHHFSISERIAFLEKCETDRRWIDYQDRKIRKGMIAFIAAMVVVGGIGYQANFGGIGQRLNDRYMESVLNKEIAKNPDRPELYRALGDIDYKWKKYSAAIENYTKALDLAPHDPETLNNLAWLYATCEDPSLRAPGLALVLARQAASVSPKAHILDTLAESYYVNGQLEMAVASARAALSAAGENRSYFKNQLYKFRQAVAKAGGV